MKRLDRIEHNLELITKAHKEVEEQQRRTEKQIEKMSAEIEKMSREIEKMNRERSAEIEKMSREISKLTDGWGRFVEGLVAPAVPKILKKFNIKIIKTLLNCKVDRNGETMEIDVIAVGDGVNKQRIIVACSVKSRLQRSDVIDFVNELKKFYIFFPEYKDYKLQGLVGGIRIDEGVDKCAENIGFYVLGSSGDAVKLLNKPGFKPKLWE